MKYRSKAKTKSLVAYKFQTPTGVAAVVENIYSLEFIVYFNASLNLM